MSFRRPHPLSFTTITPTRAPTPWRWAIRVAAILHALNELAGVRVGAYDVGSIETTGTRRPLAENSDTRCRGNLSGNVGGFRAIPDVYTPGRIWDTTKVCKDNETRTAPTSISGTDGFHRKLRTEVAKERGSEVK
jgi:hypothetical protein